MLQGEHSAILLTFIKLQFVIKSFVLSTIEWPFYTGFTVPRFSNYPAIRRRVYRNTIEIQMPVKKQIKKTKIRKKISDG